MSGAAQARRPESGFSRRADELYAEALPVAQIIDQVGTPTYIYSAGALAGRYDALDRAFGGTPHTICYSIKSNMNLAVVRTLVLRGAGVDVTSAGELARALRAGADPAKIVFSGVGKRAEEIDDALRADIRFFNVESRGELRQLDARAAALGMTARVAFRVNPDVDPKTHPYIATGLRGSKFGIPIDEAVEAYAEAKALEHIAVVGVDCHIGSQLLDLSPVEEALTRLRSLVEQLRAAGHAIGCVDIGGGLGVAYDDEQPPTPDAYAEVVLAALGSLGCEIVLEPGRWLSADAGLFATRVLYCKSNGSKHFAVVDGAMNDLLRPALYDAFQRVEPVGPARPGLRVVDVVGPVCESADFLARDRALPPIEPGDLLAVRSAGAYGFVMSSNYNSRPRAAEVLVRGDRFAVVRERETLDDLMRGESIPEDLLS